jgi:hypothetical protein
MAAPRKTTTTVETEPFLKKGQLINVDRGGRTLHNLEVLDFDDRYIKVRWDMNVSPQTEVVLVPIGDAIIGLVGER